MAKTEKRVSIASLDKVLKELERPCVCEMWHGIEVKIKYRISLAEIIAFVSDVATNCFHEAGGYMPELKDFLARCNLLTRYANFSLPDNLEHRYSLVYGTDAIECVLQQIDRAQLDEILRAIDEKLEYLCKSHISAIDNQVAQLEDMLGDLEQKAEKLFIGISPEDITKVTSAMASGQFSEERLVRAYVDQMKKGSKLNEPVKQTEGVG